MQRYVDTYLSCVFKKKIKIFNLKILTYNIIYDFKMISNEKLVDYKVADLFNKAG